MKRLIGTGFLFLCGCSTYHDAANPYSLAPPNQSTNWTPPEEILSQIAHSDSELPPMSIDETHPHSLAEVLDIGLAHNTQTMRTWADARSAAASYGKTLKNDFILSNYNMDFTAEQYPQTITVDAAGKEVDQVERSIFYTNKIGLTYVLMDFGQTRSTSNAALYSLYYADWMHNSSLQQVMQTLMDDYFNVLYQKELLFSRDADVENAAVTLESAQEKLRVGTADVSDVLQARSNFLDFKLKTVNQEHYLNDAYATLTNDMGVSSNINLDLQGFPSEYDTYQAQDFDILMEEAKQQRPDYLAALSNVEAKTWAITAAKKQYLPTVNTSFDIGNTQGNHGLHDDYDYNFHINLNIPFFQGFAQQNELRKMEAELEMAKSKLLETELKMTKEIDTSQKDISFSLEAIDYAKDFLETASEDFRVSLDKYRQGTNTIIDVINAQTNIANASALLIQAKRDYFTSLANLAYAIGSLNIKESQDEKAE